MKLNIPNKVMKVIKKVHASGFNLFIVGGSIRDLLLGKEPEDWDLATNMNLKDFAKLFAQESTMKSKYRVLKLHFMGIEFQVAQLRSEGLYKDGRHPNYIKTGATVREDVKRRDFTINGIYYDAIKSEIIDHVNGISDLKKKQIKTIGESSVRFSEDYLRILRAIRFAGKLRFEIEKKTFNSILKLSKFVAKISGERVEHEITAMLLSESAYESIELLGKSKILHNLFSEFSILPKFNSIFLKNLKSSKKKIKDASSTTNTLAWAIFLTCLYYSFDNTKQTSEIIANNSLMHDQISDLLKLKLKFNNRDRKQILIILENQISFIKSNRRENKIWKKTLRKPFIFESLEFFRIMFSSNKNDLEIYNFWTDKLENTKKKDFQPKKLIKGEDLIKLGFKKGPKIKIILKTVEEEQLEETIKNKKQALVFVKKKFIKKA